MSPCGASGTIPKRCCLVAQGAADCCCCLFNKQATNILNHLHAELELWLSMSNTCRFSLSLSLLVFSSRLRLVGLKWRVGMHRLTPSLGPETLHSSSAGWDPCGDHWAVGFTSERPSPSLWLKKLPRRHGVALSSALSAVGKMRPHPPVLPLKLVRSSNVYDFLKIGYYPNHTFRYLIDFQRA